MRICEINFKLARLSLLVAFCLMALSAALAQQETVLYNFGNGTTDGNDPLAGLVADASGNLYGTANAGGAPGVGTVFELVRGSGGIWNEKNIYVFNFNGRDGYSPWGSLIFDKAGNLYGTTGFGGLYDDGTIFELSPKSNGAWTETILHNFNGTDGQFPSASLVFDKAGNLYGTTQHGGSTTASGACSQGASLKGCGTVFELRHRPNGTWAEKVLHSFDFNGTDGFTPVASVAFDDAGDLYGTAEFGGAYNFGILFKLTPKSQGSWAETILHSFNQDGTDGIYPASGLLFDGSSNLYGTTGKGGSGLWGTVFEFSPASQGSWTETILHGFTSGADGSVPGDLTFDAAGNLYGATGAGGTYSGGIAYELSPSSSEWTETILHSFGNGIDGFYPNGSLWRDSTGNLYGTTQEGGTNQNCIFNTSCGTAFEITP